MNTIKRIVAAVTFGMVSFLGVQAATVTVKKTTTHYPWNGKVDVTYTVDGVEAGSQYAVTAFVRAGAKDYPALSTNITENGTYSFTWDAAAAGFTGRVEDAKVVFTTHEPNFAIVDLSAGAEATSYPVSYRAEVKDPTNDVYKTTKLLLKRLGGNYVGVFEVTQKQYELVMGALPDAKRPFFSLGDAAVAAKRPVERVSYEVLTENGGFFDLLGDRTDLPFALPTGEEWEAAARGAMPANKDFNIGQNNYRVLTGKTTDSVWLPKMGRYIDLWDNGVKAINGNNNPNRFTDETKGTAIVGSYNVNDNGLYDIHGNVAEWTSEKDGQGRYVLRGGSWQSSAADCAIGAKWAYAGADANQLYKCGFRVFGDAVKIEEGFVHETTATSEVFAVDVAFDPAGENKRYMTVEDKATEDHKKAYAFTYWTNNVESVAREREGGSRPWVAFDEGNAKWRPTTCGKNVATYTDDDGTEWKATFLVKDLPWEGVVTNNVAELVYDADWHDRYVTIAKPLVNYKVEYGESEDNITLPESPKYKDVGTYTVWYKITSLEPGAFYKPIVGTYQLTITPRSVKGANVTLKNVDIRFTGLVQTQQVEKVELGFKRLDGLYTNVTLVAGLEYYVANNTGTDAKGYTLKVCGTGNYKDYTNKDWEICPIDLRKNAGEGGGTGGDEYTPADDVQINLASDGHPFVYNGHEQTNYILSVSIGTQKFYPGSASFAEFDTSVSHATEVGKYTVYIYGTGNFQGTIKKDWTISPMSITNATVYLDEPFDYTGDTQTRNVTNITVETDAYSVERAPFAPAVDVPSYTIDVPLTSVNIAGKKGREASAKVGKYTIRIRAKDTADNNFCDFTTKDWYIGQRDITNAVFTISDASYGRGPKMPNATAKDRDSETVPTITLTTNVVEGVTNDWFIAEYIDNVEVASDSKIVFKGTENGNYRGVLTNDFVIAPAVISKVVVKDAWKQVVWDGKPKTITAGRVTVTTENGLTLKTDPQEYKTSGQRQATDSGKYTVTVEPLSTNFKNADPPASDTWTIVPAAPVLTWPTFYGATNVTGEAGTFVYGVSDLTVAAIARCPGEKLHIEFAETNKVIEVRDNKFHVTEKTKVTVYATFTAADGTVLEGDKTVVTLVPGQCADPKVYFKPGTAGRVSDDQFNRNSTVVTIEPSNTVNGVKVQDPSSGAFWPAWDQTKGTAWFSLLDKNKNVIREELAYVAGELKISDDTVYVVAQIRDAERQYLDSIVVTQKLTRAIDPVMNSPRVIISPAEGAVNTKRLVTIVNKDATRYPNAAIYYTVAYSNDAPAEALDPLCQQGVSTDTDWTDLDTQRKAATKRYEGPFVLDIGLYTNMQVKAVAYDEAGDDFYARSGVGKGAGARAWTIGDALDCPDQIFYNGTNTQPHAMWPQDEKWVRETNSIGQVGVDCMRSRPMTNDNLRTSSLTTFVEGPGMVVFNWRANCEDDPTGETWDHGEFVINGVITQKIDGVTGWQTVTNMIANTGTNVLTWTYVKDFAKHGEGIAESNDCIYVDNFRFVKAPEFADVSITVDPLVFNYALQLPTNEVLASGVETNYIHVVLTNPQTGASYELKEGEDFTVAATARKAAKTYANELKLKATEKSVYITGATNVSWTILPLDLMNGVVTLDNTSFTYDGDPKTVTVTKLEGRHYRDGLVNVYGVQQGWTPKSDTQTAANTYTLTVAGSQNLKGSVSTNWTISEKPFGGDLSIVLTPAAETYYGYEIKPAVTVTDATRGVQLTENTDYTLGWPSDDYVNVGTKEVAVTGKGNYATTSTNVEFKITQRNISAGSITSAYTSVSYNGQPYSNTITVKDDLGSNLVENVDYTLVGDSLTQTEAGTYTIKIEGKGNYWSTKETTWEITQADLGGATVTLDTPKPVYDGTPKTQGVTVKIGSLTVQSSEYDVTGNVQTDVKTDGDYTLTVTAKATSKNFKGSKTAPWNIAPKSILGVTIALTTNLVWNGVADWAVTNTTYTRQIVVPANVQTQAFTVADGAKTLKLDTDYTVDNASDKGTNAGAYTLKIKGKGNYDTTTEATKAWTIAPTVPMIHPNKFNPDLEEELVITGTTRVAVGRDDDLWGIKWTRTTVSTGEQKSGIAARNTASTIFTLDGTQRTILTAYCYVKNNEAVTSAVAKVDYRLGNTAKPVVVLAYTNNVPMVDEFGAPCTNEFGYVITNFCHNGQLVALTRGNVVVSNDVAAGVYKAYTNDADNAIYTDGTLRYTLDGTLPTEDSPEWTAASEIAISKTTTVIAKVFGTEYSDSAYVTNVFVRETETYTPPLVEYLPQTQDMSLWMVATNGEHVMFKVVGLQVRVSDTNSVSVADPTCKILCKTNDCEEFEYPTGGFAFSNTVKLITWIGDQNGEYVDSPAVTNIFEMDGQLSAPVIAFSNAVETVQCQKDDATTFTNAYQWVQITRAGDTFTKDTDGEIWFKTNATTWVKYTEPIKIWKGETFDAIAKNSTLGLSDSAETNVVFKQEMATLAAPKVTINDTITVKYFEVAITNEVEDASDYVTYYTLDGTDPVGLNGEGKTKSENSFAGKGTAFKVYVEAGSNITVKAKAYREVSANTDFIAVSSVTDPKSKTRTVRIGDYLRGEPEVAEEKPSTADLDAVSNAGDGYNTTWQDDSEPPMTFDTSWTNDDEVAYVEGGKSMRSGKVHDAVPGTGDGTNSVLTAKVYGPGTFTFYWKASTEFEPEDYENNVFDFCELIVDGEPTGDFIYGTNDWTKVSFTIEETNEVASEHTIQWKYIKDAEQYDEEYLGCAVEDCVWVDEFVWSACPMMDQCDVYVDELTYNRQPQAPSVVVTNRATKAELVEGTDYEIDITPQTNASNDYTFVVRGLGTTYTGSNVVTWAIKPLSITNAVVTLSGGQMYDRKNGNNPVMQYAVVESIAVGAFELVNDTTWSLASGVTNATDAGTYAITLAGSDNLTGTVSTNWVIAPRPITSDMIIIESKGKKQIVYSGIGTNVSFVLKYENSTQGLKADDYTVVPGSNIGTNAGNYKLCIDMIEGEGKNFTGSATQDWSIAKFDFDRYEGVPELTVTNFVYTGLAQTTDVAKVVAQHPYFGEIEFTNEAWVVSNNVATTVGEYWAMLYPTEGNLTGGPISNKWTISQADIEDVVVVLGPTNTYNGTVQQQTIASVTHPTIGVLTTSDYTVKDDSKNVAGKFTMTLIGTGNWAGEKKVDWEQLPALIDSITFNPASYVYDGTVKTPAITVKAGELEAKVGTDFTTNGTSSAILAGTNTVTVKGSYDPTRTGATGNFKVPSDDLTTNVTWVVEKRDITDGVTVEQSFSETTYNRKEQTNVVTVTCNGNALVEGKDYTLERLGDCTNAGTVTNRIIGIGSVFGTTNVTYTIKPVVIDTFKLAQPGRKIQRTYNGEIQTVTAFLVKAGDLTLDTTEYKLEGASGTNVDTYTATVNALSKNFADPTTTLSDTWWIVPRDITGSEVLVVLKKPIVYTGKPQKIEQDNVEKIMVKSGTLPVKGCTIVCPEKTDAGTYNDATVTPNDPNFTGSAAVEWTIEQRDITDATAIVWNSDRLLWNGAELTPTVKTITVGGPDLEAGKTLDFEGTLATLTVNGGAKTEAGRYASTVSGSKNFKGTTTNSQTWEIVPKSPAITPNDGTGKYTKVADWITVKISNDPDTQKWSIFFTTNNWAETLPYKLDESKFDITNHTVVAAYAVSVNGAVTSAISRCEYFFGNQNVAPTVALTAAEGAEKGRPQTWDNTEVKGEAKLIVAENGAVYTNFYHGGTKLSLTRFGAMTADEIEQAKASTTYGGNCPYTDGEVWYTVDLVGIGIAPTNYDDGVSKLFNPADATTWPSIDSNAVIVARTFGSQLESSAEVTNVFQRLWTQMPKPDMTAGTSFQFKQTVSITTNTLDTADWTYTNENQKIYITINDKPRFLYTNAFELTWADVGADGSNVVVKAVSTYGADYLDSIVETQTFTHVTTVFPMPTMTPSATFKHKTPGQLVAITNNAPLGKGGVLKYSTNGVDWVVCSGGDVGTYEFFVQETTTVLACVFAENAHDYTTSATNSATYTYVPYQYNTPTITPASQVFDTATLNVTVTRPAAPAGDDPAHVGVLRYKLDAGNWTDVAGDSKSFDVGDTTTVVAEVYDPSGDHVTSAQVTNTYTRTLKAVPQMWLEDLAGNKLIEEGTADVPATNYWHKSQLKITGVDVSDAKVYYKIDGGKPVECTAGTAFQVSNTFEVIAWAAVASKGLTGPAVTNVYTRHWETLVEPEIDLLNPEGAVTNVFRHSGDTVYVTNGTVQVGHDAVAWTNQTVKIAVIPGVTNGVLTAATDWVVYKEGTTIFTNNTNTVWAVVEADDYLPSTNTVWFVREIDALDAPTINLSNEKSRTNVVVTFDMPAGANTIWYTYAVTNDDAEVELVDPVGEEYDATSAAHLASKAWTIASNAVNIAIKPHQQVFVKAIAYSENEDLELPCTTRCFTGKSAVTNAVISLDWTVADGLDVPDWKTFTVTSSQRQGSDAAVVEDNEVKTCGDSSICFTNVNDSQWLAVSTTVTGPGTVVFEWKTLCEKGPHDYNYDHMTFYVNGTPICKLDGDSGWQTVSNRINGAIGTKNVLKWVYEKDDSEHGASGDEAWLDHFRWTADVTQLEITQPLEDWAQEYLYPDDFDTLYNPDESPNLANWQEMLGWTSAQGRTYWECYVLGLDPEDYESELVITSPTFDGYSGAVSVTFNPRVAGRTYTLVGKKSLTDVYWTDLKVMEADSSSSEPTTITSRAAVVGDGYQFFQLRVKMTQPAE